MNCIKLLLLIFCSYFIFLNQAFSEDFIPPENIKEKSRLSFKNLNFLATESGRTYVTSENGRYVFQGDLFDVWNGRKITSVSEMNYFTNRIDLDFMGVKAEKMFALQIGTGEKKAYVFSDPECYYCHKLAKEVQELSDVNNEFSVFFVIVPAISEKSIKKTRKIFGIAQKDKNKALECFIKDSCKDLDDPFKDEDLNFDSIDYNRLVARVLSIEGFPFIVNPEGIISPGMPEDIFFFLRQK